MEPSIGRIVHYHSIAYSGPVPALITRVHPSGAVDLTVFPPGREPDPGVRELGRRGTLAENDSYPCWSWPPRV